MVMVERITAIYLGTFKWFFSHLDFANNFFQAGLLLFITLLIIGYFCKLFIKSI